MPKSPHPVSDIVFAKGDDVPPCHQQKSVSLYLHVPFCKHLCPYCAFYKQENPPAETIDRLVDALISEIAWYAPQQLQLRSIFWGGGTPTLLTAVQWQKLYAAITAAFHIPEGTEHTVEVNPETVTPEMLNTLHSISVNRLSIGIQSFFAKPLQFLGRQHGPETLKIALSHIANGPIKNINLDIMYGLPEAAEQRISDELDMALSWPITHLSTYALSIEKGTPFAKKKVVSPEDATWQEYLQIRERLAQEGFQHYEISAFAKSGKTCAHNLAYWTLSPYIGIGPSAASYWRGMSYKNVSDLARYVDNPRPPIAKKSPEFSAQNMASDYMIANFRRLDVIDTQHISQDLGIDAPVVYAEAFQTLISRGWLTQLTPNKYKITDEGIRMHNYLLEVFV